MRKYGLIFLICFMVLSIIPSGLGLAKTKPTKDPKSLVVGLNSTPQISTIGDTMVLFDIKDRINHVKLIDQKHRRLAFSYDLPINDPQSYSIEDSSYFYKIIRDNNEAFLLDVYSGKLVKIPNAKNYRVYASGVVFAYKEGLLGDLYDSSSKQVINDVYLIDSNTIYRNNDLCFFDGYHMDLTKILHIDNTLMIQASVSSWYDYAPIPINNDKTGKLHFENKDLYYGSEGMKDGKVANWLMVLGAGSWQNGLFIVENGQLVLYKLDGSKQIIGSFKPFTDYHESYIYNYGPNKLAIVQNDKTLYVYNLIYGTVEMLPKPAEVNRVIWESNSRIYMTVDTIMRDGPLQDGLYIYDGEQVRMLSDCPWRNKQYFKHYLVFELYGPIGIGDHVRPGVVIYDFNTKKIKWLTNYPGYQISVDGKSIVACGWDNLYLLKEGTWKPTKKLGDGHPPDLRLRMLARKVKGLLDAERADIVGKTVAISYIPAWEKIYFCDGTKVWSVAAAGQYTYLLYDDSYSPLILTPDEKAYYCVTEVKGKKYFNLKSIY